ncbi:MAG: hypothetical protein ACK4K7_02805 [Allosphingosinicella sp.]|uniref:hypothetical protein n=1 Tax=Allosphingosinicella sp. TaxID=2823234 RepID=UPI003933105E
MKITRMMLACMMAATAAPLAAQSGGDAGAESTKAAPAIAPPPPGMGQVVFYRSSRVGALISCRVHEGGEVVNRLPPGRYFVHNTTPGVHEYSVRSEATDVIRLEVEEGETQYVRCAIGMGLGVGRPNLSPQSRDDFERRGRGLDEMAPYGGDRDG